MKWIIDDIRSGLAQLLRWQFWLVFAILGLFVLLSWLVAQYALRTDSVLSFLRVMPGNCRTMTNGMIIGAFSGMIFFGLMAMLTLGEVQRHLVARQRRALRDMRHSLYWSIFWGCCAVLIAVGALLFFKANCY